jgi:hypothetical protein
VKVTQTLSARQLVASIRKSIAFLGKDLIMMAYAISDQPTHLAQ